MDRHIAQTNSGASEANQAAHQAADVDIGVIYTYERDMAHPLLATLAQSGDSVAMRLMLVDNASEGIDEFAHYFPQTCVIRNDARLGYGANINRILAASTARYVLILNTDMLFDPEEQCIAKMVQFMDTHPDCGLSACRLYHPDGNYGHPARRFPTVPMIISRRVTGVQLFPWAHDRYLYRERENRSTFQCDWVSGCFMMIRRSAMEMVGPVDPQFRKYFEDTDYCRQMAEHGWRVMFHGATYCYHLEQRASKQIFSRDAWTHLGSYCKWLLKWGPQASQRPQRSLAVAAPTEPSHLPPEQPNKAA